MLFERIPLKSENLTLKFKSETLQKIVFRSHDLATRKRYVQLVESVTNNNGEVKYVVCLLFLIIF